MNTNNTRRAAVPGCALVLTLGAVMLAPLSAQASNNPLDSVGSAVGSATGALAPVLTPTTTPSSGPELVPALVNSVTSVTDQTGLTSASSTTPNGISTEVLGIPVNVGQSATSGAITVPGVVSVGSGSGSADGSGSGSGSGGLAVTLGGTGNGSIDGTGSGSIDGTATGTTSTTTNTTNNTTITGSDTAAASTPAATATATPAPTASAAPAVVKVLSLAASPSVGTVYPVKDGYRDDVVFRVAARLSSSARTAVTGSAVLTRGSKAITQWAVSQPTQDLRWNGLDHGKLVAGTYVLTATMKDATGASHTTTAKVVASGKRLIASTQKVSALSVSGTHAMAAAARAGLAKGNVTVKVTTVASKVEGKHFLYFVKNGKRLTVPIKQGTHTSKAILVPKAFTSFTLKHTWKKGQVKLKAIRYTYSYQSLR